MKIGGEEFTKVEKDMDTKAKYRFLYWPILVCIVLLSTSCSASESKEFGIYLLGQDLPAGQFLDADLNALELQAQPVIDTADIVSYNGDTHEIELTAPAYGRVQDLFKSSVGVGGKPFVVCVGKERIYGGAFWTPVSSQSYAGVVIMLPIAEDRQTIKLELGYPVEGAFTGNDPRSDPRVLRSLGSAGKLKQE